MPIPVPLYQLAALPSIAIFIYKSFRISIFYYIKQLQKVLIKGYACTYKYIGGEHYDEGI
ncbi:hypothetical protein CFB3_13740 [Clostridium folliculivorans]|uniref:Uncharacterized protein n=1 Tax=Clostridium folliculivorans TaxID=2886038 RepID=A0A9W6D8X9_9CLOT|nr:hypothetical protein CFOLD11_00480 [Clostridium folliculivorans]GKU29268.1 hypothetical protein CFB3_13740 [Clostridium folliculivorans]